MAFGDRRLDIVISWIQQNPAVVKDVQKKLTSLGKSYDYLRTNVGNLNLTEKEQQIFLKQLSSTYQQMQVRTGATQQTVRMLSSALSGTGKEIQKTAATGDVFDKILARMGYRLSWVGFRLAIMGRLITGVLLAPMTKMVGVLTGWEKSMDTVALALGLQEAGLGETGRTAEELRQTLIDLTEEGPRVQTAMMGLDTTWAMLATQSAPALESMIGVLQNSLEGVGGAIITSMVDTISQAVPSIGDFIDSLEPFEDELGVAAAYLLVFAVAMTGIGTAIFMARPALIALQFLWGTNLIQLAALIVALGTYRDILREVAGEKYWQEKLPDEAMAIKGPAAGPGFRLDLWLQDLLSGTLGGPGPGGPTGLMDLFRERTMGMGLGGQAFIPPVVTQEMDVDVSINIENMISEIDLDAMVVRLTDELAVALRQRGRP